MTPFNTEIIEFDDCRVRIDYHHELYSEPPWERSEGHGPVRKSTIPNFSSSNDKRPGERPMNRACRNEYQYYYDWAAACKLARKDGWNAPPYDAPNRVERAVQADFDFLSGWVNDEWHYAGVICTVVDEEGDVVKGPDGRYEDDCWGFDTAANYHETAGREMADELAKRYLAEVAQPEEETRV